MSYVEALLTVSERIYACHCVAVLIGRITRLARPFVCPFVRPSAPYRLLLTRNKKARLSLWNTRYSLYMSLLQYWPSRSSKGSDFHLIWKPVCHYLLMISSNLGRISHRFWYVANFSLKRTFFHPAPFNPKFENVSLLLHPPNFVRREPRYRVNYSILVQKVLPHDPTLSHNTFFSDNPTDRRQTDDNRAINAWSIAEPKV